MYRPSANRHRMRLLQLVWTLLACAPCATAHADNAAPQVIPAGQEQLVLSMLGGTDTLASCVLSGADVEARRIVARYRCDGTSDDATIVLEVGARPSSRGTEHFAVLPPSDDVPPALVDAVLHRVRGAERSLRFVSAIRAPSNRVVETPRPYALATRGHRAKTAALLLGLMIVMALLESGTRRRAAVLAVASPLLLALGVTAFGAESSSTPGTSFALRSAAAFVFTLVSARLVYLACRPPEPQDTDASPAAPSLIETRFAGWRWPLAFFLATLLALVIRGEHAPLHSDTASDLLIARDCAEGTTCRDAGAVASFGELRHGALWLHVLEARVRLGLGIEAIEAAAAIAMAGASALLALTAVRGFGVRPSPLLWATWLVPTVVTSHYPVLWNPTLLPLALVALTYGLMRGVRTGRTLGFVGGAFALAIAVDLHLAMLLVLPLFLAILIAFAERPVASLCYASVILVATISLDSPGGFTHDVERLAGFAHLPVVALVGACFSGLALRRSIRVRHPSTPVPLVACAMIALHLLTLLALSALTGRGVESRYLAPIVAPLALVICALLEPRVGPVIRASLTLVSASAFFVMPLRLPGIDVRDVPPIAEALYARASYRELFVHLRSSEGFSLLSTLPAFEPRQRHAQRLEHDLVVLRIERARLPDVVTGNITVVDLDARHVALIVEMSPRVDARTMQVCVDLDCTRVTVSAEALVRGRDVHGWHALAFPSIGALVRRFGRVGPDATVTYHLQVRPGSEGARVHILSQHCPGWSIVRAPMMTERSEQSVAIPPDASGEIVFAAKGCGFYGWLPAFGELPDTPWLSRLANDARTPHLRR